MTATRDLCSRTMLLSLAAMLGGCIPRQQAVEPGVQVDPSVIRQEPPSPVDGGPQPLFDDVAGVGADVGPTPVAGSAWMSRVVTPDAVSVVGGQHVVLAGDTLRSIGNRTGAGSEAIARANGLAAPFIIKVGQQLVIPGGRYHEVKPGEAGIAIARAYGTDWATLVAMNGLEAPFVLRIGQRLRIPDDAMPVGGNKGQGSSASGTAPASRAQAFSVDIDELIAGATPAGSGATSPDSADILPPGFGTGAVASLPATVGGFAWPISGGRIVRKFGPYGEGRVNQGIDIAATQGSDIRAAADGAVVYAGRDVAVFDGLVLLRHAEGWTTAYGYASDLLVKEGQVVRKGDVIARVGTGDGEDGSRLHFEMRKARVPVDPVKQLGN